MQAVLHIITMSEQQDEQQAEQAPSATKRPPKTSAGTSDDDDDDDDDDNDDSKVERKRLQALEARAVAKAKATADAAFRPSVAVLNAPSPDALLQQVDGVSLHDYESKDSVYVGREVPVAAGGRLTVPIQVSTPGSVVEYAIELKLYDIGFGITAERDEGTTLVRETSKVDASQSPVTQKFLVGTTPCLIQLEFDNEHSWFREKQVSYKITVTPPSKESLAAGRRRRAQACLKNVEDDLSAADQRYTAASQQRATLEKQVAKLMAELAETKKACQVAEKEEAWLKERKALRLEQQRLLKDRLQNGWKDETELNGGK